MTALLALDLLGAEPVAVFGMLDRTAARDAFARQDVDLVFVSGRHVPNRLAALAAVGARPVFSLGALESEGRIARDPLFPDVPEMTEIYANRHGLRPEGPLFDAWMATAAAVRLDFGLILPQLTPASLVALWRHAGAQAAVSPDVISAAAAAGVQPLAGSAATASTASILADSNAILELRRWLGARYDWHPG